MLTLGFVALAAVNPVGRELTDQLHYPATVGVASQVATAGIGLLVWLLMWAQAQAFGGRLPARLVPWSLPVGPDGIATAGARGAQLVPWSALAAVRIGPTRAAGRPRTRTAGSRSACWAS